ncbi:MAG: 4-alpha-glucanotransferase [Ruminococcaceae bacterium]|nr:4-alpha-glucanotransferase [Oscillospiraceae bacterium]
MSLKRSSGVLMSVSAIPSEYGVGVFGRECIEFAKEIKDMGFSYWQVLPFTPLDYGNSPYGSDSAFAGNELYISPDLMAEAGFVTQAEADSTKYSGSPYVADYAFARENREKLMRLAFSKLDKAKKDEIGVFIMSSGLHDHCLFRALKKRNDDKKFWEWSIGAKHSDALSLQPELIEEVLYHGFVQYLFYTQWFETKEQINALGIKIIGDMPIYVSRDSADVWANPELFDIDKETYIPSRVAGCPPDYFSEDGQLWGNPLYDWKYHKANGYEWWIKRIARQFEMYDMLRIDHFRAFASYWAINGKSKTARDGIWKKGPGMSLFKAVRNSLGDVPIIAEDLGVFGDDVVKLLNDSRFPGMRIIQFGFDPNDDPTHLPHNYPKNCIAYTGTHDNNTLLGWLWEASEEERAFALDYVGFDHGDWGKGGYDAPACRKIIESVWRSTAVLAIIPFQDMCGFGSDARMNIPGDDSGKWKFRTTFETISGIDADYFRKINSVFRRK